MTQPYGVDTDAMEQSVQMIKRTSASAEKQRKEHAAAKAAEQEKTTSTYR